MGVPQFTSEFALIDVTTGPIRLASYLKKTGSVRATIEVEIENQYGNNDGTSIEFAARVLDVKIAEDT